MTSTRKKPILLLVELGMLLAFLAYTLVQSFQVHSDVMAEYILRREKHMDFYLKLAETLVSNDKSEEMDRFIEEARKNNHFDFYIRQYNGVPIAHGAPEGTKPDDLIVPEDQAGKVIINEKVTLKTTALADGSLLTLGIVKRVDEYLKATFQERWKILVQDIVVPSVLALWIFAFYIRDILQVLKVFRLQKKRDYKRIKTRSIESDVFIRGLAGYEQTVDALVLQNQAFGNQVLPSLKKEILSGKKPPYDFKCTMVRTDINNFSSIFHTHDVEMFMGVINGFFEEVSHIVSRYDGLIHEFVGDEVIFYFKDEDHQNSFMTALSAIRDVNEVASRINQKTKSDYGYPFTVKSSLSHGKIRFGELVNGYSLAGSILIETVRILSHIHEKDENVVYFDETYRPRVTDICDVAEATKVHLKGYSGTHTLYAYHAHRDLTDLLFRLNQKTVEDLTYYRSDADLSRTIRHLKRYHATLAPETLFRAIQILRSIHVTKSDGSISGALLDWLDYLADLKSAIDPKKNTRVLSSASMLAMNLIPRSEYTGEVETRLANHLRLHDKRAVANVVEVLTHFKSGGDPEFFSKLLEHENNRIAANALVYHGTQDLNADITKRLRRMLNSKSVYFIASSLYAIGEIAAHHRQRDIIYYGAQVEFLKLVQLIPGFVSHSDEMVRRQAFIAAKKSGDDAVVERVWDEVEAKNQESLWNEAEKHLGHRRAEELRLRRVA